MNKDLIELSLKNYEYLQDRINNIHPNYYISTLNLLLWKNYNINVYFKVDKDAIYIIIKPNSILNVNGENIDSFYILRPIIKKNEISYNYLIKSVNLVKDEIKKNSCVFFDRLFDDDLKYLKKYKIISKNDSSYIYLTEKLKTFAGKKLQKKRNLLNFFTKNYINNVKLTKYDGSQDEQIIEYSKNHIIETSGNIREHEINSIKDLLNTKNSNLKGSLMYYDNTLIGVTIGYVRENIYEIFLEKASRKFKGSYQYLLSENLKLNEISSKFIDRQDSEREEGLEQSKRSYKPYYVFMTYLVKVNKNGNN